MRRLGSYIQSNGAFCWCAVLVCTLVLGIYPYSAFVVTRYGSLVKDIGWMADLRNDAWVIKQVAPDGPAAGLLHEGDRILAFNGEKRAVLLSHDLKEPIAGS